MAGQSLNKYFSWLKEFESSQESYTSADIDYFTPLPAKKDWMLLGISLFSLAKSTLAESDIMVALYVTLPSTTQSGVIPKMITTQMFGSSMTPPTIALEKKISNEQNYIDRFKDGHGIVRILTREFNIPLDCEIIYSEYERYDSDGKCYDRCLVFV